MGFVTLEDFAGLAEISFFPQQIDEYRKICSLGGPVWITGRVNIHLASLTVEANACGPLQLCA